MDKNGGRGGALGSSTGSWEQAAEQQNSAGCNTRGEGYVWAPAGPGGVLSFT